VIGNVTTDGRKRWAAEFHDKIAIFGGLGIVNERGEKGGMKKTKEFKFTAKSLLVNTDIFKFKGMMFV
jgi:hypothetical protein